MINDNGKKIYLQNEDYKVEELVASFGMTINLGDYESARIDKSMRVRIINEKLSMEEIAEMHDSLAKIVRKKVKNEAKAIMNSEVVS